MVKSVVFHKFFIDVVIQRCLIHYLRIVSFFISVGNKLHKHTYQKRSRSDSNLNNFTSTDIPHC